MTTTAITARLRITPSTVRRWLRRFEQGGTGALRQDAPGRGRKRTISADMIRSVVAAAGEIDENGLHPSTRALARRFGISAASVCRLLRPAQQRSSNSRRAPCR